MQSKRKDELEARRWQRQRLAELGRERPGLKTGEKKKRFTQHIEENTPCPESPQATHEDGQQDQEI